MSTYPLKWISDSVAVGYAPRSESDLSTIRAQGIEAIVNLCAECYDLNETESNYGFNVYYLPIVDETTPTLEALDDVIVWMQQIIHSGQRVLVHCRYGIGRTGTVVLSYLIHAGFGFKEAKKMMKQTPSWPANREQEELVDQFALKVGKASSLERPQVARPKVISKFFDRWNSLSKWG